MNNCYFSSAFQDALYCICLEDHDEVIDLSLGFFK